jgi:signal transduction histidine kinase
MLQSLRLRYGNLTIRSKLITSFSLLIVLMIIVIGTNVLIKNYTTDPAHESLYSSMREIMFAKEADYQFTQGRAVEEEAMSRYVSYGYTNIVSMYDERAPNMEAAVDALDQMMGVEDEDSSEASNAEEFAEITDIQAQILEYKTTMGSLVSELSTHGSVLHGMGGDVITPLNQVHLVINASAPIASATQYIEEFDVQSIVAFPSDIARLQAAINASDLSEDQKSELMTLTTQSLDAFRAMRAVDTQMIEHFMALGPMGDSINEGIAGLISQEEAKMAAAQHDLDEAEQLQIRLTWGLAIMAMILALLIALAMSQSISKPVTELTTISQQIAAGDYHERATVRYTDEVGKLAQSFNTMVSAVSQREQELREQTQQLTVATARAKEAARIKGEFLANVSHELRTPLNAIIGYSDMLLMGISGELSEKQSQKITRLRENGIRLLNLINDILDITRIEARRVDLVQKPFAVRPMFTRLTAQTEVLAHDKGLEFLTEFAPDLPETIVGDEKRIEQIVVNLLSNAFKFTQEGQVVLRVCLDAADTWMIQVSDTGIGIPPHARTLIFEEFRQLDGASTRAYTGTGLGLAITRNLVRIMEGQITVDSDLGKGSTFTVTLPLNTEQVEAN